MQKRGFIGPAVVILLVVLLSIAGLIGLGVYISKKSPGPTATNPVVTQTPTNETASWKTYSASELDQSQGFNYSIKYPPNWFANTTGGGSGAANVLLSPVQQSSVSMISPCIRVVNFTWPAKKTTNDTLQDVSNGANSGQTYDANHNLVAITTDISTENITLNGVMGIKKTIKEYNNNGVLTTKVFLDGGPAKKLNGQENIYSFESCPNTQDQTFNQILSTFKFTQ